MQNVISSSAAGRLCVRLLSVALIVAAAGCGARPIIEKNVPTGSKAEVLSTLNSQAEATHSVLADVDVKVQVKMNNPETCDGKLAAQFPDKLRIRGHHPLMDLPPFDIGSDGQTWFVHIQMGKQNEIHLGPTAALVQQFDPMAMLKPSDIVMALGVGPIMENPPASELLFNRMPGYYLLTELVNNNSGRYVAKRIYIDPELMAIYKMETYRPDGAIDMIADMTYGARTGRERTVPTTARIRLLRTDALMLDLGLKNRQAGTDLPAKRFAVPDTEGIPSVIRHGEK